MITLVRTTAIRRFVARLRELFLSVGKLSRLERVSLVLLMLATGYLVSIAIDFRAGWSATEPAPERMIRLRIVDGSGDAANIAEVGKLFSDKMEGGSEFELVYKEKFSGRVLPETILIARGEQTADAEKLARFLGLGTDRIIHKPLERDSRNISVTLVLGEDFKRSVLDGFKKKETQS